MKCSYIYNYIYIYSARSRNLHNPRIALRNLGILTLARNPRIAHALYSRIVHTICSPARALSWNTVSESWTSKNRCLRSSAKILLWMVTAIKGSKTISRAKGDNIIRLLKKEGDTNDYTPKFSRISMTPLFSLAGGVLHLWRTFMMSSTGSMQQVKTILAQRRQ